MAAFDLDKYLRRPKTWSQLLSRSGVAKSTLGLRLNRTGIHHTKMEVYSKMGWFKDLEDKWKCYDVAQHCAIIFEAWMHLDMVKDDNDPANVRAMARNLERAASQLKMYSEVLYSRLEGDAEESIEETEVAE